MDDSAWTAVGLVVAVVLFYLGSRIRSRSVNRHRRSESSQSDTSE
jgi:hypothetical protein